MGDGFMSDFKRFFLRGLAAVLPTVLTIAILVWVFGQIDRYFGRYINIAVAYGIALVQTTVRNPPGFRAALGTRFHEVYAWWGRWFWWTGFLAAIAAIYVFGRFVASFLGRSLWRMIERMLNRTPVVRQVYPNIKQVTDFLLSEKKIEFSRVVAVEYPRKGLWSIGLVTAPGMRALHQALGAELLTVFVPSSPTPFTGYTITVRREEVIDLPVSIDDAVRFVVSGGVIMPISQQLSDAEVEQARQGILPSPRGKETLA